MSKGSSVPSSGPSSPAWKAEFVEAMDKALDKLQARIDAEGPVDEDDPKAVRRAERMKRDMKSTRRSMVSIRRLLGPE